MPDDRNHNISDAFADEFIAHAIDTLRFTETVRADVLALLRGLEQELIHDIVDADIGAVKATVYQIGRQTKLLATVQKTIATAYREVGSTVQSHLVDLSALAQMRTVKLVNEVFEADLITPALTPADLRELVTDSMIQGHPQKDWWAKQADDLQHRFAGEIRQGVAQGETNDQLVQRVRGTPTGRTVDAVVDGEDVTLPEYGGGIMDITKNQATALVRTATQTISSNINDAVYQDNQDVLRGRQLIVTLDSRTCIYCMSLSGGAWDFKGQPLPESPVKKLFPGLTPYHFGDRCFFIPVTKSWEELAGRRIPGLSEIPESTQSSMDGQVAGNLTYDSWLKRKSVDFQKEVLGEDRWKLWSSGKLGFSQMVDQSDRPLSIAELYKKAGVALPA